MKRKTNLFYVKGLDSNFITFSNYTESLTSNFLTTDTKLYPYKFLCLYVPMLDVSDVDSYIMIKQKFIEHLISTYENKLAVIRDCCAEYGKDVSKFAHPLSYLLESILKFDGNSIINYIGDTIEYDYNGIYCDLIFTINDNLNYVVNFEENEESMLVKENIDYDNKLTLDSELLYGWTEAELTKLDYAHVKPIYDINEDYECLGKYEKIRYSKKNDLDLKFNIIIPLYNTTNLFDLINHPLNNDICTDNGTTYYLDINYKKSNLTANDLFVPYGMWFAGVNSIELKYDPINKLRTSWSLTLSSQFKPFPYSNVDVKDKYGVSNAAAYATFAQILKNYNSLSKHILDMNASILSLLNQIKDILNKLNTININNPMDNESSNDLYLDLVDRLNVIDNKLSQHDKWDLVE